MHRDDLEAHPPIHVDFAGRHFLLHAVDGADLVAHKMQCGSYEAPLPIIIAAVLTRIGGLFIDVGANNGVYSLMASTMHPDVRIVAFEPFPPVLELLHSNIRLNGLDTRIEVVELALSDTDGSAPFFLPDPGHGLVETSASLHAGFIAGSEFAMSVPTKRLDSIDLGAPITVAKVDIEGFELEFLRGGEATIKRDRPFIFAEMLNGAAEKFPEITRKMADLNYLAFRLRPDMAILAHWIVCDEQAWNYGFIPREKMALFREVCAVHGLEIVSPA